MEIFLVIEGKIVRKFSVFDLPAIVHLKKKTKSKSVSSNVLLVAKSGRQGYPSSAMIEIFFSGNHRFRAEVTFRHRSSKHFTQIYFVTCYIFSEIQKHHLFVSVDRGGKA